jgi:hypothetical protein
MEEGAVAVFTALAVAPLLFHARDHVGGGHVYCGYLLIEAFQVATEAWAEDPVHVVVL